VQPYSRGLRPPPSLAGRVNAGTVSGAPTLLASVIVPVRDNPAGIRALIEALGKQTLARDRFEIVIGDDGSREQVVKEIDGTAGWVHVTRGTPRTSYAARNRAVRASRGAVLVFCDSDCLPEPEWLEQGLAALENADIVAGEVSFVAPNRPTVWSFLTVDMFLDQGRNVILSRGVTANLFVDRELFVELGGFDDSLPSGGDYDLVRRAVDSGARLSYAPRAVVLHPTIDDARPFLRKVWTTNRWSAARRAREGEPFSLLAILEFVPFYGAAIARRRALRPLVRLYRPRLEMTGIPATWRDDLRTLSILYLFVAYIAGLGRVRGWLEGRRLVSRTTETHRPLDTIEAGEPEPRRV